MRMDWGQWGVICEPDARRCELRYAQPKEGCSEQAADQRTLLLFVHIVSE